MACITSLSKMHGIMIHHLFGSWSAESPISSCPSPACFCVRRWKYGGCCGLAVDFEQRAGKTQIPIAKSELDSWCSHQIGHWIMWSSPWSRRSIDDLCGNIVKKIWITNLAGKEEVKWMKCRISLKAYVSTESMYGSDFSIPLERNPGSSLFTACLLRTL